MGMRYFFGVMEVLPSVEGRFQFLLRVFWLPLTVSAQCPRRWDWASF